jgi:citrate synthase
MSENTPVISSIANAPSSSGLEGVILLDSLHVPEELFTPMFTVGRVLGWCAHILEQRALRKLIRPASKYVGPRRD